MEDLLRSLRNLGLGAPSPSQLLELLDTDEEVQKRLAQLLSLSSVLDGEGGEEGGAGGAAMMMGQDLLEEAVNALLDSFRKTLDRQREASKKEATTKAPTKVKLAPRKALLARQDAALKRAEQQRQEAGRGYRPRLVVDGKVSYHSTRPLASLKRISCGDLNLAPRRYEGAYLLCRVMTPLLLYVGVTFIVDDPSGAAIPVSISHFTSDINQSQSSVSKLLPLGTVLAIREPFVSLDHASRAGPCTGKAAMGIRVDSPTDIVIVEVEDWLLEGVEWKEVLPLSSCPPSTSTVWLRDGILSRQLRQGSSPPAQPPSLSAIRETIEDFVASDRPGAAYRELCAARRLALVNNDSLKDVEARILYELRAWSGAKDAFASTSAQGSSEGGPDSLRKDTDFAVPISELSPVQAAKRTERRLASESAGLTDEEVASIYFASSGHSPNPRLDTSEYIGPVQVRDIPGAGRGLVTTREVQPGELLLCCRSYGSAYPSDPESLSSPILRLNVDNGVVSTTSQVRAQTNLIHALVDRPDMLAVPVLGLTAGPSMEYSRFATEPYPPRARMELDPMKAVNEYKSLDVDAAYVDGVLRFNAFGPAQAPASSHSHKHAEESQGELGRSTQPHPLPAILNHACLPNVSSVFFSDIVTTRALDVLPEGTEIVHQYVRGETPFPIRTAQLSKHGFECACPLCILDRADGAEASGRRARITEGESRAVFERSRLLFKSFKLAEVGSRDASLAGEVKEAHEDVVEALKNLRERIDETYTASSKTYPKERAQLKPEVFSTLDRQTRHLALFSDDVNVVLDSAGDALRCVGAQVALRDGQGQILDKLPRLHFDPSIDLVLFVATYLQNRGLKEQSLRWIQAAYHAHQAMVGGGQPVFLHRWKSDSIAPALELWLS